jgi:hypothetical protein
VTDNPAGGAAPQIVGVSAGTVPSGGTRISGLADEQAVRALHFNDLLIHARILTYPLAVPRSFGVLGVCHGTYGCGHVEIQSAESIVGTSGFM